ncbi:hypothetical protein [uncultured Thiodictyon sp.]|uniref:hypothetical protein n=1 Tax=uncultured Thiodictyon sp. TaxID=1846217 RepID=UPI0025E112D9|nr:hypothetical protein [uncultured Thiodictyon sp.]
MAQTTTTPDSMAGHQGQAAKPAPQGFRLPDPNAPPPSLTDGGALGSNPPGSTAAPTIPLTSIDGVRSDTLPRDLAIGGGILLVLVIAFFFAKGAYANLLVGKRVAPRSANAAGWWLFVLLTSLATCGVLAVVDQVRFVTPIYLASFLGVALLALILMLVTGRR